MMLFDVYAALAKIEGNGEIAIQHPPPATNATLATLGAKKATKEGCVAVVAEVAAPQPDIQKPPPKRKTGAEIVLAAIDLGNVEGCKWQSRHGAIASETGLGGTVTYQLIDRLIDQGRVIQAPDGVLSVVRG